MSLTARILVALVAGLAAGIMLPRLGAGLESNIIAVAAPIGRAWLNALQMPLVPLIFGLLVNGVSSAADSARSGAVAVRALILFAVLLLSSALVAALLAPTLLLAWPVPGDAVSALSAPAASASPAVAQAEPSAEWLLSFIPANPIAAAAGSEMVAVVVFALLFGFAVTRIDPGLRDRLLGVVTALVDALLVLVGWVLKVGPIGIFALALVASSRSGVATAGALLHYIAIIVVVIGAVTALVYPLAILGGRIGLGRFASAVLPSQLFAFSTQSSIATLPAMIAASEQGLQVAPAVRNIVLPMSVSLFRITSPAANLAVAVYIAALSGVPLGPATLALGIAVAALVSLAAVGLPSQVSFFTTIGPICLAMGLPIEALPLLLAVETVPDIFRTVGNVTADLAVTRIAGRGVVDVEPAPVEFVSEAPARGG